MPSRRPAARNRGNSTWSPPGSARPDHRLCGSGRMPTSAAANAVTTGRRTGAPRASALPSGSERSRAMLVSDVLRGKGHEVVKIRHDETVADAVRKLAEHRIGALVVEDRWTRMGGIFSERDFVNATAREGAAALNHRVADLMSSRVITCEPTDRIDAVLAKMTVARIRHVPVVENDRLVGIVSIGDLVKHRLEEKELEANV